MLSDMTPCYSTTLIYQNSCVEKLHFDNSYVENLQKKGLSAEEHLQQREQILQQHKNDLDDLERNLANERQEAERTALMDWEVQYARAKLNLKERHYKVIAILLFTYPHHS